jgi:hypothetical protein
VAPTDLLPAHFPRFLDPQNGNICPRLSFEPQFWRQKLTRNGARVLTNQNFLIFLISGHELRGELTATLAVDEFLLVWRPQSISLKHCISYEM